MDETARPQTSAEKRYLRALRARARRALRKVLRLYSLIPLVVGFLFFTQAGWIWQKSSLPALALLAAMFLAPLVFVLVRIRYIDAAIASGMARDLRIRASAVVLFEDTKIKPALHQAFALQTGPDETLFLNDPAIKISAQFPNTDFSLVSLIDGPLDTGVAIVKRGTKLKPLRTLPPDAFQRPAHLSRAKGSLENLETILDEWPRDQLA